MNQSSPSVPGVVPAPADGRSFADLSNYADTLRQVSKPIEGSYAGTIVALAPLTGVSAPMRRGLTRTVARLCRPIWRGKSFTGEEGTNLWLGKAPGRRFGDFTQVVADGVLLLTYDLGSNPLLLRRIRADLWDIGAGTYLGRMRYESARGSHTLMYYTLER